MLSRGGSKKKAFTLADHFRGGKYSPVSVRPVSVAALLREKEDADIFPEESDAVKRPGTVMGTLSGGLGSDSERDEGDRLDIPEPDTNGELSDEGPEGQLDEDPDNVPFVEQRRVEVYVWEARDLPIMDDEPGCTTDPYCKIRCCDSVQTTKILRKCLDPVWNERFSLKVPLKAGEAEVDDHLTLDIMDWDESAHDLVGSVKLKLGPRHDPFPEKISDKVVVPRIAMSGTSTTTSLEGWFPLLDPDGEPVKGPGGRKPATVRASISHKHEIRHTSYRPSKDFLAAAAKLPGQRTRREVLCMTREMVTQMPAVALLSSKFVVLLCEIAELKRWKARDVVELQNKTALADALHFVLRGRFTLHSQRTGPHMSMYKVLKSRSFGQSTSFGPKMGWRGPGEAFGEGALVLQEGTSRTSVCVSEEGLTLRVDRRECERLMEQFRRKEAGYSRTLHGSILAADPATRDVHTLAAFLKASHCSLLARLSDDSLAALANAARLTRVEAGTIVDTHEHGDCVHVLCAGTVSVLRAHRSPDMLHSLPVPGECIDVLGPSGTFGLRGGGEQLALLAREAVDFLSIPRAELARVFWRDEVHSRILASPEAMREPVKEAAKGGKRALRGRFASIKDVVRAPSLKKLSKPPKMPLCYVMAVFHRLRALHGLEGIASDRLWLLAQSGKLHEVVGMTERVQGGAGVVVKGEAELKAYAAAEKPEEDGGERRMVGVGDTVLGGTEITCDKYVAIFWWEQAEWDYAVLPLGGAEEWETLSVGRERETVPEIPEEDIILALLQVPILREIPQKMLSELTRHVRSVSYPDGAIPLSDGEQDCCLYIVKEGKVTVYQDRDLEDSCMAAQLCGSDVMYKESFGARSATLDAGMAFAQVEFVTGAKSGLTAVCRGATKLWVLPAECLSSEVHSVMTLSIERSPPVLAGYSSLGSDGELLVLRMLKDLEGHNLRKQLSWKATTFLCGHMQRHVLQAGEALLVRDQTRTSVLAMLSGKVFVMSGNAVSKDENEGDSRQQAQAAVAILRTGDVFEGHHARAVEDLLGQEVKLIAVAKEESTLYVVDSSNYRISLRKTVADAVVSARLVLMKLPLFTSLPLFLFERLARLVKWRKLARDDRAYSSEDESEKHIKFLSSGEFKVTKRLAHTTPLAMLGPGCCFGVLNRDQQQQSSSDINEIGQAAPMQFAIFASSEATMLEIPAKELVHLLPEDVVWKLQEELEANSLLVQRSTANDASAILLRPHAADSPLAKRRAIRRASLPDEEVLSPDEDFDANPPARLPVDTGPMSKVLYQTGYTSGGMTSFFENVANGSIYPLHEAQSRAPMGKPPEEVLPSLRPKFLADKIAQIQRKAHLTALQPNPIAKILSPRALSRLQTRQKGLKVLQMFQSKVDMLRKDDHQRASLQAKADEVKRERLEAQALRDFMIKNIDLVHSKTDTKKERQEKQEKIEAAMAKQRAVNEQHEQAKLERATNAINRKVVNDQRHLERVQALRKQSADLKKQAVWMMLAALGERMAAWQHTFAYVRAVREDFGMWVAAAISIQRRFRKHVYGVVRKRKAKAVALIIKNFRIFYMLLKIEKKKRSTPIIRQFLQEYVLQMHDAIFHFRKFRNNVKKIQRFWRLASLYLEIIYNVVVKTWDQVEYKIRKEEAERLRKEEMKGRAKSRPPPAAKKLDVVVPALPQILKLPQIWKLMRTVRLEHTKKKTAWRDDFKEWVSREEYRVLIQREKSLLQGGGDVARDPLLQTWLDETDPPPRCPVLNPVPPTEELDRVIRETYAAQAKAAAEAKARKGSRSPLRGRGSPIRRG